MRLRAERSYLFRLRGANDKEMWLEHGDRSNIAYQGATGIDDATIIYTPKRSGEILVCTNGAPDLDVMRLADEREMTERNDCRDSDDPHDVPNCGIENQGLVRGRIGSPSDSDLWSVILARGHTYEFRVRGAGDDAGDNGGTLEDPQVELYEMSWMQATGWTRTKVAANDNVSTSNKNSVVTYIYPDLDEPQSPFWVAVRGANGTTGTYTLTVKGSPMTVGSGTVLIGNIQRLAGGGLVPRRYHGAVFTTGGKAAGYSLSSIEIDLATSGNSTDVEIWVHEESSGQPGTLVAQMNAPSSYVTGVNAFSVPVNTTLDADRTYFVVIHSAADNIGNTSWIVEDLGGAAGWSIRDTRFISDSRSGPYREPRVHRRATGRQRVPGTVLRDTARRRRITKAEERNLPRSDPPRMRPSRPACRYAPISVGRLRRFRWYQWFKLADESRDILRYGLPDTLEVDIEVSMHESIAHADDLGPGNFRARFHELRADA